MQMYLPLHSAMPQPSAIMPKVASSNAIVLGGTGSYAVNVGIGTTTPGNFLEINSGTGEYQDYD